MAYIAILILTLVTGVFIYRKLDYPDNRFLVLIFAGAMFVRSTVSVVFTDITYINNFGGLGFLSGDDLLYSMKGLSIMHKLADGTFVYTLQEFGVNLYTCILAVFYRIFGFNLVASKFINCYLGALLPVAAYFVSKKLTGQNVSAKILAVICAFYPSFIYWSSHNLKDPLIMLAVWLGIYLVLKTISRELKVLDIVIFGLYAFIILNLQIMYVYQISLIGLYFVLSYASKPIKICALIAIAAFVVYVAVEQDLYAKFMIFSEEHQLKIALGDDSGYYLYSKNFMNNIIDGKPDPVGFMTVYVKGMTYFLFIPFFWKLNSIMQFAVMPQILVWYILLVFAVPGFIKMLKSKPGANGAVFLFLIIGISFWAFMEGNAGTAFRHRDHFASVIFLYSAIGIQNFFISANKDERLK